ncbi:Mannosyltransferase [Psidium guajava]|nr:Mannosyltransferase [Psidium guajava]
MEAEGWRMSMTDVQILASSHHRRPVEKTAWIIVLVSFVHTTPSSSMENDGTCAPKSGHQPSEWVPRRILKNVRTLVIGE